MLLIIVVTAGRMGDKENFTLMLRRILGVLDDGGDDVLRGVGVDRGQPDVRRVLADAAKRLGDQVLGWLDHQGLLAQPGRAGGMLARSERLPRSREGINSSDNQLLTYKSWIITGALG